LEDWGADREVYQAGGGDPGRPGLCDQVSGGVREGRPCFFLLFPVVLVIVEAEEECHYGRKNVQKRNFGNKGYPVDIDIDKLIQINGYILRKHGQRLNYTKLIKLLYLSDKEALKDTHQTITGDDYVCMDNGPVLSHLYDLIKGRCRDQKKQSLWDSRFLCSNYELIAATDRIPDDELSVFEKEILDRVDEQFKDYDFHKMIDYVHHHCPEWKNPRGTSVTLETREILKSIGKTEEEIEWIIEEQESFKKEDAIFKTLAV
jgi:uncharacterized phage-associated protein